MEEWGERLDGKTVGLDSAPLIYFIEDHPSYGAELEPFFGMVEAGRIRVVTSVITLVEVLVHPIRRGDTKLAQEYREVLLGSRGFQTLPVSAEVGELAARLRAVHISVSRMRSNWRPPRMPAPPAS